MTTTTANPSCLNCGATFSGKAISRKRRFARCEHCGTVHNVAALLGVPPDSDIPILTKKGVVYRETVDGIEVALKQKTNLLLAVPGVLLLVVAFGAGIVGYVSDLLGTQTWFWLPGIACALLGGTLVGFSDRTAKVAFDAQGITFQAGIETAQAWRLKHDQVRGFIALAYRGGVRVMLVDTGGGRHLIGKEVLTTSEVVLTLLEHARRTMGGTGEGIAARPVSSAPMRQRAKLPKARFKGLRQSAEGETAVYCRAKAPPPPPEKAKTRQIRRLQCEGCGAPIPISRIDRKQRTAVCGYCGLVADVDSFFKMRLPARRKLVLAPNQWFADNDKHVRFTFFFGGKTIVYANHTLKHMALIPFVLGCVMTLIVGDAPLPLGFVLLAVIPLPLFIGSGYMMYRYFKSKSKSDRLEVILTETSLTGTGAEPGSLRNFEVPIGNIKQVVAQSYEEGNGRIGFMVLAEDKSGNRWRVATDLDHSGTAIEIARRFNARLEAIRGKRKAA